MKLTWLTERDTGHVSFCILAVSFVIRRLLAALYFFFHFCICILHCFVLVFWIALYLYFALVGKVLVGRSWIAAPVFLRDCSVCIIWRIGSRPLCTRHTSAVHCPSATCTNSNALLQCSSLQVVEAPMHCNYQPMNYIECQCIFVAARWSLALCCQAALVDNNLFVFCFLFFLYFVLCILNCVVKLLCSRLWCAHRIAHNAFPNNPALPMNNHVFFIFECFKYLSLTWLWFGLNQLLQIP